jgi:hypothetical protein
MNEGRIAPMEVRHAPTDLDRELTHGWPVQGHVRIVDELEEASSRHVLHDDTRGFDAHPEDL